ncbi:MAG: 1-deoxy-D-xylulose-5-phosphate reductoisomerase [Bacilli bacterium]|nr:1-deoxy-D-xylulose-5-phosphate reductoisomerase [Bacilli bacterium]
MKNVLLLGASGSIGTQTLDVLKKYQNRFNLVSFSVGKKKEYIDVILKDFPNVTSVYVTSDEDKKEYQNKYQHIKFYSEKDGFKKLIEDVNFDICVESLVGMAGLIPAIETLKKNKILCLANKEALVTGGHIINDLLDKGYGKLYPIDSEHVALAKCLTNIDKNDVKGLYVTASGGALRDIPLDKLNEMKASDALKHPNWKMGAKITIDCATMMNKGFEIIEAYYLFRFPLDMIRVSMHRESLVHSYIELNNGELILDYGKPDMHGPIEYALLEGKSEFEVVKTNSLDTLKDCHFSNFDEKRYPLTKLAIECLKVGGSKLVALNGANEVAVNLFLNDRISYLDINKLVSEVVNEVEENKFPSLEEILKIDEFARKEVERMAR